MPLKRSNSFTHGGPPAIACHCVWTILAFVLGYIMCSMRSSPGHPITKVAAPIPQLSADQTWDGEISSLIFRPGEPIPINHPSATGEVSKVLKQRLIDGKEAVIPGLVHLSMVEFGDGGYGGAEVLGFPSHVHGEGFHEVFVVLEGMGVMELNGISTGPLTHGSAVHIPPGVIHTGRALREENGRSLRMLYFALLKEEKI